MKTAQLLKPTLVTTGPLLNPFHGKHYLHKTGEVCELIDEVKELRDVIGNAGCIGVHSLQMLLIDLAYSNCKEQAYFHHGCHVAI